MNYDRIQLLQDFAHGTKKELDKDKPQWAVIKEREKPLDVMVQAALRAFDWGNCPSTEQAGNHDEWLTMDYGIVRNNASVYKTVPLPPHRTIATIGFELIVTPSNYDEDDTMMPPSSDTAIKAIAVFTGMGEFLGFTDDSLFSTHLASFCKTLFDGQPDEQ